MPSLGDGVERRLELAPAGHRAAAPGLAGLRAPRKRRDQARRGGGSVQIQGARPAPGRRSPAAGKRHRSLEQGCSPPTHSPKRPRRAPGSPAVLPGSVARSRMPSRTAPGPSACRAVIPPPPCCSLPARRREGCWRTGRRNRPGGGRAPCRRAGAPRAPRSDRPRDCRRRPAAMAPAPGLVRARASIAASRSAAPTRPPPADTSTSAGLAGRGPGGGGGGIDHIAGIDQPVPQRGGERKGEVERDQLRIGVHQDAVVVGQRQIAHPGVALAARACAPGCRAPSTAARAGAASPRRPRAAAAARAERRAGRTGTFP